MATPARGRGQSYTCQMRTVSLVSCQAGCGVSFAWPAAPCPLSQGAGLRGGALKFCSPHTPPISRLASRGGACRFGLGDEAAGAVAPGLGIAGGDLGTSRGELVRAHPPSIAARAA